MASGGGGSSESRQRSSTRSGTIHPAFALLQQAFGVDPTINKTGQFQLPKGGGLPDFFGEGGAFAPDTFAGLGNIFDPIDSGARFDLPGLRDMVAGGLGTIGEAAETGLIEPAIELGGQIFEDFLGDASERFGTQFGLGSGDSDFNAAIARESRRMASELANLAQDRRLAAASGLPSAAGAAGALEREFEGITRARTPQEQLLSQLLRVVGINSQATSSGRSSGSSSSKQGQGSILGG
jgi:hypothetical protein